MTLVRFKDGRRVSPFDNFFSDFLNEVGKYPAKFSEPAVNIVEKEDGFRIDIAAPGLEKADFKVNLEKDVLTVSTEKKAETEETKENYTRKEFQFSSFSRSFTLPDSVDSSKIEGKYENGILSLELPKREEAKVQPAREISIG
jgi:HSP20 family protein